MLGTQKRAGPREGPRPSRSTPGRWLPCAGSDAAVALYNDTIKAVCGGLADDGLNVVYVDASSKYDPNGPDLSFDLIHPSDQGMAKIADAYLLTMGK